jgi:hypothetical protein
MPLLTSIIAASRRRVTVDPDAADYFARIVAAGSTISAGNQAAVNAFVAGCKADGIWAAIKASCLLAGPDDLTGALVPLVGAAPTNFNFVAGDYNRVTGLAGDGSTKYLDSNRAGNAQPTNSTHIAVYRSTSEVRNNTQCALGTTAYATQLVTTSNLRFYRVNDNGTGVSDTATTAGFWGASRTSSTNVNRQFCGTSLSPETTAAASTPTSTTLHVFARSASTFSTARLSFYSIGESLDLALLDARLATYMSALT